MDSISQQGVLLFLPTGETWQAIERIRDGVLDESNEELLKKYALPEDFDWTYNHLHPSDASTGLDVEDMSDEWCLARAKKGDISDLVAIAEWRPALAWYWLLIAEDIGHDTRSNIEYIENGTNLHYDDDGYAWNGVLLDLVEAYCKGNVVERNLERAARHLETYLESGPISELERFVKDLDGEAIAMVDAQTGKAPFRKVRHQLRRLETLHELSAPSIIIQNELSRLVDEVETLQTLL